MRILLQRVSRASVRVAGETVGRIGFGYVALVGAGAGDDEATADKMARKIGNLRIFSDINGKTNLAAADVSAEILVISQFTLYADCRKGNRPSFTSAGPPDRAEALYLRFAEACGGYFTRVEKGVFGANMELELVNDGPFTVWLDDAELGFN